MSDEVVWMGMVGAPPWLDDPVRVEQLRREEIRDQLQRLATLPGSHPIAVQLRSAEDPDRPEWSESTLGRELHSAALRRPLRTAATRSAGPKRA